MVERQEELDSLDRSPGGRTSDMQRVSVIIGDDVQINMGGVPSAANLPRMSAMPVAVVVPRGEFCWRVWVDFSQPRITTICMLEILLTRGQL